MTYKIAFRNIGIASYELLRNHNLIRVNNAEGNLSMFYDADIHKFCEGQLVTIPPEEDAIKEGCNLLFNQQRKIRKVWFRWYQRQWLIFFRDKSNTDEYGGLLNLRAVERAELTLQRHGSSHDGFEPTIELPISKIKVYTGGIDTLGDILVLGKHIDTESQIITSPSGVFLEDLIGYRTI